jgi:hypothetical protein
VWFQVQELSEAEDAGCSDAGSKLVLDDSSIGIVGDADVRPPVSKLSDVDPASTRIRGHVFSTKAAGQNRSRESPSTPALLGVAPPLRAFDSAGFAEWLAMSEAGEAGRVEWLGY